MHGSDGEKDARTERRREDCGKVKADVETWPHLSLQILRMCRIRLRQKARGYSRHPVKMIGTSTRRPGAREFNQDAASSSQAWQKIQKVRGDSSLQETQTPKAKTKFGHTISRYLQTAYRTWRRFLRYVRQRYGLSPRDRMENSRSERSYMVYIHVRHSSSCSSCWYRLYGEFCRSARNQSKKSFRQLFQVTRKLITGPN